MFEGFHLLFAARPLFQVFKDLIDICIVAYVIYRALLVVRGTRAIQMAVGLGIVVLIYLGAKAAQLVTLLSLLSWLLSSIILVVVVIFQNDIRRALIRVGGTAWFSGGREQQSRVIDEVVAAATELARHRMGALIAFEQDANVLEFVKSEGIQLECTVTRELLVSLFVPESVNKLHDGAVLIRDLKIARAGVFFPMPETKILDAQLGSRHRAALGITEETDAVVVVVSEERGTISFCFSGNIVSNLDGQSLRHALLGLFGRSSRKKRPAAAKKVEEKSQPPKVVSESIKTPLASAAKEIPTPKPRQREMDDDSIVARVSVPGAAPHKLLSTPMPTTRAPERAEKVDSGRQSVTNEAPVPKDKETSATSTPIPRSTFVPTPPSKDTPNEPTPTPTPGDDS